MSSRWTGFFVWALVTACAALWGFKIFAATRPVPSTATMPAAAMAAQGPMPRLFGVVAEPEQPEQVQAAESDRFQLVGVIAPAGGSSGLALVAVDGQPPKPWKIGATLEGSTTLLAVAKRTAQFGPSGGPAQFTLELPAPAPPETGTLPAAMSQPDGPAPVPRAPTARPQVQPVPQTAGVPIPGAVRGAQPMGRPGMPLRPGAYQPGMIPPNAVPPGRQAPLAGSQQIQQQAPPPTQDGQVQKDEE
jgi:general secretion pathway protein C